MPPPLKYDPNSPDEQPVPLPSAPLISITSTLSLQPPLSRKGKGPGLLIFSPDYHSSYANVKEKKTLDPLPLFKWAEEGYAVVWIDSEKVTTRDVQSNLERGIEELKKREEVDIKDKFGVLGRYLSPWHHVKRYWRTEDDSLRWQASRCCHCLCLKLSLNRRYHFSR